MRRLQVCLLALLFGIAATACGGDDDDGAEGTTIAPAESAPAATAPDGTAAVPTTAAVASASTTEAPTETAPAEGDEWDAVVEAARAEGSVTIYSSQFPDRLEAFAQDFEDEYGITVEVVRGIDGDNSAAIEVEHDAGRTADMWVSASPTLMEPKAAEGGWFAPALGPAFDDPAYDRTENYLDGDYFVVGAAAVTFGWNTDLYPDGLDDYEDLLDPALAGGLIGVVEPTAPAIVDLYLWMDETFGDGFVEALAAQEPRIYPSAVPMGQALASGEIVASPGVLPQDDAKAAGAPVDSGLSESGVWGTRYYGALIEGSPHPNAAQLLANYMVTAEGQAAINRGLPAVLPDVPGTLTDVSNVRKQDQTQLTAENVAAYQQRWAELFR